MFPYRDRLTGTRFIEEISRHGEAEPGGREVSKAVMMINIRRGSEDSIPTLAMRLEQRYKMSSEAVYYHGTTSDHAINILECGIDLTKSRARQDFSNGTGFYVTDNIDRAVEWAQTKARGGTGAIIAFKISRDLETEEPHLTLEVETQKGRDLWSKMVNYFRKSIFDPEIDLLQKNQKFITGPVSKIGTLSYDFDQTCIRDPDYAKRYGRLENILFVIFIA